MKDEVLERHFAGINNQFVKIDQRFDKMDERFVESDDNFTSIKQDFNRMDERFDQQDNLLQEMARNLVLVLDIVGKFDVALRYSESMLRNHERRIGKLERQAVN